MEITEFKSKLTLAQVLQHLTETAAKFIIKSKLVTNVQ
jgi:hypothetical protein